MFGNVFAPWIAGLATVAVLSTAAVLSTMAVLSTPTAAWCGDVRADAARMSVSAAPSDTAARYREERAVLLARIRELEERQRRAIADRDVAHSGAIMIAALLALAAGVILLQRRSLRHRAYELQAEMDKLKEGTDSALSRQRDEFRREKERQRMFARKLITSQEHERKRIARDLHDTIGQDLLVIHNCALLAQQDVSSGRPSPKLDEVVALSEGAIENVRRIAYDLRPYQLERIGLTETLRAALNRLAESGGLRLDMRVDPIDGMFSSEEEINVYRIMQEALSNVLHHAHAGHCTVEVRHDTDAVRLTVHDDGCGFDAAGMHVRGSTGFGLRGMDERVQMLGGSMNIRSVPGGGTHLEIRLPKLAAQQ